jgi:hypothetical protein
MFNQGMWGGLIHHEVTNGKESRLIPLSISSFPKFIMGRILCEFWEFE